MVFLLFVYCVSADQSQAVPPQIGDQAPDFSLVDVSGNQIRLSDFKGRKNVVLVFYARHAWPSCLEQLGGLQQNISEFKKLDSAIIAIASNGEPNDVKKTKSSLGITFILIPKPNKKIVKDYGLKYDFFNAAFGTIIIDKKGIIRFKSLDNAYSRTSTAKIINELHIIQ